MNYFNGAFVPSSDGKTFEQRNPANLKEVTGVFPASTRGDARGAIDAAQKAFASWSRLTAYKRAEYLRAALELMKQRRDAIAVVITAENGKTINESKGEIDSAIKEMDWQISEGLRLGGRTVASSLDGVFAYSTRQPLGVCSIISPWNFPFNVPTRKITPALMAGNTCVFKPASLTPRVGLEFMKLYIDAGLPAGVLNFVTGGGTTVGEELISNPLVKAISFTGSTAVGQSIHRKAAQIMARTQLEMGGKNPIVVLEDANLEDAARAAVTAAYACAGQWCTSTSRAIVVGKIARPFIERVVELAGKLIVGPGTSDKTTMGPVCGTEQLKNILRYIEVGKSEGAKCLCGGQQITAGGLDAGCFIAPTVFAGVGPTMTIAREEIFGPVLSIIEVPTFEEAMAVANSVDFGLSSSVYTNDLQKAFTFLERTEVGLTHVNLLSALKEPQLTFGGIKASGFGIPEAGETGIEFFTEHKVAYVKYR